MKASSAGMLIAPVAVNSYVISDISLASTAAGFDGEHVAFFHALGGSGLDKRDFWAVTMFVRQAALVADWSGT